ncbi:MAG: bifunctional (p)ppGpp synthetase/guanosine-3',5'-bis(diphosphate) 3'-pyrophosphohydrolase [Bdellovibrionales bacterium]|nr:bifunctional (p)ppGpp synthetase/guanosine-3',5'-bis(diphosphate) 3'-pyrophosphohydrolase [Bdellovibrionales bacterium]
MNLSRDLKGIQENLPETIDDFIDGIEGVYSSKDCEYLRRVYEFAEKAHSGQIRRSGEPYISHPLGVASILADLRLDLATVATGLLHDTVEDTSVNLDEIKTQFGEVTMNLVDGVTKISKIKFRHTHEKQGENIRKMIVAMGKDVRVILVKLADRLHNMRTMGSMPFEKQARIAQETLDIYAPLAGRLGISELKVELEDLSFRFSQTEAYYDLSQKVEKKKREREKYIDDVKRFLETELTDKANVEFEVSGRPKHLYSIYKKMQMRNVDYDQIYDVLAFRVIVKTIPDCYAVLGVVHSMWKPIPGRFKDFIAMPKANNYQSLHTTVIGPGAERIEVQIRTEEMHLIAERGIAAHWKYKEDSRGGSHTNSKAMDKFNWLRELVSMHQQTNSSDEFLENIKSDLVESEIYVFTPKGEVKEFPDGATPIDFAYSVHTDVGHKIVAARVNGKLVTLRHLLQNGDTVEVITSKTQSPSKDWLKYCVTTRAKSRIRSHIKTEQRERAKDFGSELLEKAFRKVGVNANRFYKGELFDEYLKSVGCNNLDDLFVFVGYGKSTPANVIESLMPQQKPIEEENTTFLEKALKSAINKRRKSASVVNVGGMDDVLVRFAKCCHPIPGDPITGFITRGRGITIHRADCEKAFELDQDRAIDVEWNSTNSNDEGRMVKLRVISYDISGLLKAMTETFQSFNVDIHNAQIRTTRDGKAISNFDVGVRDTSQLEQVMAGLRKIKGIIGVTRLTHT